MVGVVAAAAVALTVVLGVAWLESPPAVTPLVGHQLPDVEFGLGAGSGTVPLSRFRGNLLLLCFLSLQDKAGLTQLETLERTYRRYAPRGVAVATVVVDREPLPIATFLRRHPITHYVLHDPDRRATLPVFGEPAPPLVFVIDPDGRLVTVIRKSLPAESPELRELLEPFLRPDPI
jgi:peroxiredoxin